MREQTVDPVLRHGQLGIVVVVRMDPHAVGKGRKPDIGFER